MTQLAPMETLRRVTLNHQHEEIHGILLDATTAAALLTVYDALSTANQAKFERMMNAGPGPLMRLVDFTWKNVHA